MKRLRNLVFLAVCALFLLVIGGATPEAYDPYCADGPEGGKFVYFGQDGFVDEETADGICSALIANTCQAACWNVCELPPYSEDNGECSTEEDPITLDWRYEAECRCYYDIPQ